MDDKVENPPSQRQRERRAILRYGLKLGATVGSVIGLADAVLTQEKRRYTGDELDKKALDALDIFYEAAKTQEPELYSQINNPTGIVFAYYTIRLELGKLDEKQTPAEIAQHFVTRMTGGALAGAVAMPAILLLAEALGKKIDDVFPTQEPNRRSLLKKAGAILTGTTLGSSVAVALPNRYTLEELEEKSLKQLENDANGKNWKPSETITRYLEIKEELSKVSPPLTEQQREGREEIGAYVGGGLAVAGLMASAIDNSTSTQQSYRKTSNTRNFSSNDRDR